MTHYTEQGCRPLKWARILVLLISGTSKVPIGGRSSLFPSLAFLLKGTSFSSSPHSPDVSSC